MTMMLALPAQAREREVIPVLSGSGFFVSSQGHVITNAHVVKDCQQIVVRGPVPNSAATLIDRDEAQDLALLRADAAPPEIAVLRESEGIAAGDTTHIIGFPGEHGIRAKHAMNQGAMGGSLKGAPQKNLVQFSNAVAQGNSGGPLLDESGYVVGVVTGRATITSFRPDNPEEKKVSEASYAVSLAALKEFLEKNRVHYRSREPSAPLSSGRIESRAQGFTVNVHCRQ